MSAAEQRPLGSLRAANAERTVRLGEFSSKIRLWSGTGITDPGEQTGGGTPGEPRAATNPVATGKRLVVTDDNTATLSPIAEEVDPTEVVSIPAGEHGKTLESVTRIVERALQMGFARDDTIVGFGGGVVCDVAAMAASLVLRGCRLVLVPTTLLAIADAAVGGKTGANLGGYKNMVGTFYPAAEVRIDPSLVGTLSEREYLSGLAEVIKAGLLAGGRLLEFVDRQRTSLVNRESQAVREAAWQAVLYKADVVEADFRETGIRAHLNLGHTFGHALEAVAGLGAYTHGEAVAWGIDRAMVLGRRISITDAHYADRVRDLLRAYGYRVGPSPVDVDRIVVAMKADKKRKAGEVRFVLQRGPGETIVTPVNEDTVRRALLTDA